MSDWILIVLIVAGLISMSITIGWKLRRPFKLPKKEEKKEKGLSQDELDIIRSEGEGLCLRDKVDEDNDQ